LAVVMSRWVLTPPSPRPETDQLLPFFSAIAALLALGARRPSGPILWQKSGPGILSLRNRDDLKLNQVGPFSGPTLQKRNVVAFYDLKAAAKVRCHPTTDEADAIWHQATFFMEPGINCLRVLVSEMLDHHKEHR
jgi:hypothetical protein